MACIITIDGKNFTEKQFKNLLKSGLLYETLQRGLVALPVDTTPIAAPQKAIPMFRKNFVYNKEDAFQAMKQIFGLKDKEAKAVVAVMDRMANAWAARNNKSAEDYYRTISFIKPADKAIINSQNVLFSGLNEFTFTDMMEFEDDLNRSSFTVNKDGKEVGVVEINKNNKGQYYISWLNRTAGDTGDGAKIFKAVTQNLVNQGVEVGIDTAITSGGFKMMEKLAEEGFLIKTGEEITEPNQKTRKPMIYAEAPFKINTEVVKPNENPLLFQSDRAQALNAAVKGFELEADPKAFSGAFRTKNGKATRELASRINAWMNSQGLSGIKFFYEPTYGTINAVPTVPSNGVLFQSNNKQELIDKAASLADNVKGIYGTIFKDNVEGSLFEAAVQANSSEAEKAGAVKVFGQEIVDIAQQLFPNAKVGDDYLRQGAQAAILMGQDGQDIIYALTDPNVTSPLHELTHKWERELTPEERSQILQWAGTPEWTRETSEKVARGFEKYLADGEAPVPALQKLFNQFKDWLTNIYKGIVGSSIDIELNDNMKAIYAAMLGEEYKATVTEQVEQEKALEETKPEETVDIQHDWKTPIEENDSNKEFKKSLVQQAYENKAFDDALNNNELTIDQVEEIIKAAGLPAHLVDKILFRMTNPEATYNVEGLLTMKPNAVFQQIANYFLDNGQLENVIKNEGISMQDALALLDTIKSDENLSKLNELKNFVNEELARQAREEEAYKANVQKLKEEQDEAERLKKGGFELGEPVLFQKSKFRIVDTLEDAQGRFMEFILAEEGTGRNVSATPDQLIKWNDKYEKEWKVSKKIESLKKEIGTETAPVEEKELHSDTENTNLQFVSFAQVAEKGIDAEHYNAVLSIARKFSAMFPLLKMQVIYSDDDIKGYIANGIVVVNLKNATQDTPIHEVMHTFVMVLQQSKPELYANLLKEFRNLGNIYNVYLDDVKVNEKYQFLTKEQMEEEAFVQYLGERISDLHDSDGNFIDPVVYVEPASVVKFVTKKEEGTKDRPVETFSVVSNGTELGVLKIKTFEGVTTILDSTVNEDSFTQDIYDKIKKKTGAEIIQSESKKISNNKLLELEEGNFETDEKDTQEYYEAKGYKAVGEVKSTAGYNGKSFTKVKMVHAKAQSIVGTFFEKFYKWFVDLLRSVIPKSKVGRKAVEFTDVDSAIYDPTTEKISFFKPAGNRAERIDTVTDEETGETKKVKKSKRDVPSFTSTVETLREDLERRGASESEIEDIVNQVNGHFDPKAKLKLDLSQSYVPNTGNLETVNDSSKLAFNFFSSPAPVLDIKELPADLSIDNLATLLSYGGNKLRVDLVPYANALAELEAFQYTQADAARDLMKHTEQRLKMLGDTHKRIGLEESSTVKGEYFALKELLNKYSDVKFIEQYIRQGIGALSDAAKIVRFVQDAIKNGESNDEYMNQILQRDIREAQALMAFYDNIPSLLERNRELFEQEDNDYFNSIMTRATKRRSDINNIVVDLTADWLFPTLESSQKNIAEKDRLSKEQFKQNIRVASADVDFAGYWLSAVANSKDPLTAALGIKIKDELNKNYEEEADSLQRLRILFDKFLKDTGIHNTVKAVEEYYKNNFLRKAKIWELTSIDKEGVKHYGYVERWAFNQEYLTDVHAENRRQEIERLKNQLGEPNNYEEREIFNNKLKQWDDANPLESPRYLNPTFQKLKNNEYYMFLYNMYKESNGKYEGRQLEHGIIPQAYNGGSFADKVKNGFASAKEVVSGEGNVLQKAKNLSVTAANSLFDKNSFDKIQALNLDGTYHMSVKSPFTHLIDEKDLSFKLNESVYGFHTSANQYRILKSNQANIENLKLILNGNVDLGIKARKVLKTKIKTRDGKTGGELVWDQIQGLPPQDKEQHAKQITKQLNAFINDTFYGVSENNQEFNVGPVVINTNKLADNLGFATAMLNMVGNVIAGLSNITIGNAMTLGESIGGKYYSPKHWLKAQKTYMQSLLSGKFMADSVDPVKSKITQLGIIFDAIQGEFRDKYGKAITGNIMQKYVTKDTLFIINHMAEHQIQLQGMLSLMYNTEVTLKDGTKTNLYDAYVKNDKGFYKVREDANWTEEDKLKFIKTLHGLSRDLNGNYASYDKAMIQRYAFGKLILQYRKYLYTAWRSRIGAKRVDYERGTTQEGYYRAFMGNLVNDIKEYNLGALKRNLYDPIFNKEGISKEQAYAARKTMFDIAMISGMTLMAAMLAGGEAPKGDDDDEWVRKMALLWALRFRSDVSSFSLTAPQEVSRMITNPSASFNTVKQFSEFLGQFSNDLSNGQFETYDRRTGSHESGDYKLMSKFEKLIPGYRQWLRLQSPGDQLKYYDLINKNVK